MSTSDKWLTIQEVADRWRVGYDTVRRMIPKKLPCLMAGSVYRISKDVVERIEREAEQSEIQAGLRNVKRASAFAKASKDHFPDC